jgi:hypothetical protein
VTAPGTEVNWHSNRQARVKKTSIIFGDIVMNPNGTARTASETMICWSG